eukprot:scaffold1036_cov93-Cylindrotheca_fusiformis.AAC.3
MRDPYDEQFGKQVFSSGSCCGRSSISLSTIQEECSLDYCSSLSSFESVSSFDSALISGDSTVSLSSGGRFESFARCCRNVSRINPTMPVRNGGGGGRRPAEVQYEFNFSDLPRVDRIDDRSNGDQADEIHDGADDDDAYPNSRVTHGGAEYTQPLNDCDDDDDDDGGDEDDFRDHFSSTCSVVSDFRQDEWSIETKTSMSSSVTQSDKSSSLNKKKLVAENSDHAKAA